MTYGDIYDKIIVETHGADTPQTEVVSALYGAEGIIGRLQRQIQEDHDYWFMESSTTKTLISGTATYDIDYEFKREILLKIKDQNNIYATPLTVLSLGQLDTLSATTGEPIKYYIDFNSSTSYRRINLWPTPSFTAPATRTLNVRYYGYLSKLSDVQGTFRTTTDMLSKEAPYLIIFKAAAKVCKLIENYEKMQVLEQYASEELNNLRAKDFHYKSANLGKIPSKRI